MSSSIVRHVAPIGWASEARSRLPRGRHSLTRDEVTQSQRTRLLRAMADECADRGFAGTTAAGVYQRAGVSSRAFYENFKDVRDCFLAAYDASVGVTLDALVEVEWSGEPYAQFGAMLEKYLELLAGEHAIARTFLVEVYGAGPDALQRRLEVHRRFVTALERTLAPKRKLSAADRFAIESLVGAVTFQVTIKVMSGDFRGLRGLRDPLLDTACRLCPWIAPSERTP
jgi:AcrR family transcriptional regulator